MARHPPRMAPPPEKRLGAPWALPGRPAVHSNFSDATQGTRRFNGHAVSMTDDQTTPTAAGGQRTTTSTPAAHPPAGTPPDESPGSFDSPLSPEVPQFPAPPPPGPYVASSDHVTATHPSV